MGWIGCVHCEKFRCNFTAQTCALILPFQSALHRLSCSNETIQHAPKHYEMHQIMSLGSNGVDWVRSLQPILHRVLCSDETLTNAPKHYETHKNMNLGSNGVDRVLSLRKNSNAT